MTNGWPAAAATLRIARRDAWRHKGRSALIVAMVAIPVLGLAAGDVLARTMQLSASERLSREIGQADVSLQLIGRHVTQGVDPTTGYTQSSRGKPPRGRDLARAQAAALRLIGARHESTLLDTSTRVAAHGRQVEASLVAVSLPEPITTGIASVLDGRAPRTPQEIGVTPRLASRLGVSIGDTADIGGRQRTVTGLLQDPNNFQAETVYSGSVSALDPRIPVILAATDRPVTWAEVKTLNALGFLVASRFVIEHPPAGVPNLHGTGEYSRSDRVGVATVAIGLAVLEVILLAGAAFAVGARRQRRELALIAATGGDASQIRRVVLAGGLVLGAVGGVLGLAAGVAVGRLALPQVAHLVGRAPGHFDVRPFELLAVLLTGVVTGVLASALPARSAARDDVLAALTGRRGAVRTPRRVIALGITMIVVGALIAGRSGEQIHFKEILAGAVISEIGFVLCSSAVVGLVGRAARRLPLASRLAVRDAARHRGRSGPAVAAVMAAVAGSIAVSTYFVSTIQRDRDNYAPLARIGQPVLGLKTGGADFVQRRADAFDVVRRTLGASRLVPVPEVDCQVHQRICQPLYLVASDTTSVDVAVGGASLLRALTGRVDVSAERALASGRVVMFSRYVTPLTRDDHKTGRATALRGLSYFLDDVGSSGTATAGIMSPALAARLHGHVETSQYLAVVAGVPSQQQVDLASEQLSSSSVLLLERGYQPGGYSAGVVILAIVAGLVTLGATAVSVGLSMAESKPDLVTLAAVGGRPRTRRLLVANQAGVVALLGAVQGVVAGLIPAWAILHAVRDIPFVVPWTTILITVVGIPALAMMGTAVLAGSRLTLDRRAT